MRSTKSGWRWNTAKAFLRPTCYGRPNFEMWTGAQAVRLLFGVQTQAQAKVRSAARACRCGQGHEMVQVHASAEVLPCAGSGELAATAATVGHRSGRLAGAAWHSRGGRLARCGRQFADHLQIRAVYQVRGVQTLNTLVHSRWGKARMALQYAPRSGPMSMAPSQLGAFTQLARAALARHPVPRAAL